jgi:general stress protein YciG
MEEENEAVQEYARKGGSATSSLGDKLKEKLGGHENSDS